MILVEYILPFLLVLTVLVFVHELGHYLAARWCGVRVEVFSVGFGPELFGRTDRAGTRWKFSAIPLGGYVKMLGDMDASSRPDPDYAQNAAPDGTAAPADGASPIDLEHAFPSKSVGQRAFIVAAGPLANFLFAAVVLAILFATAGHPLPRSIVGQVVEDSPAAEAGLQTGDVITAIDGTAVSRFQDLLVAVPAAGEPIAAEEPRRSLSFADYQRIVRGETVRPVTLDVSRDGRAWTVDVTPAGRTFIGSSGQETAVYRIGVGVNMEPYGVVDAAVEGAYETVRLSWLTLAFLGNLITSGDGAEDLGGPIRIAQLSGDSAQGGALNLLWFIGILSINLGLINLLPIPVLDGGHLLFYAAEALRGRPLGPRIQEYGFRIGLALVLTLIVFATWNDLVNLQVF